MGDLSTSLSGDIRFGQMESLVVRLKEQDEEAFAEVFELYKDLVFTLCSKLLADRDEALDVTQEVFLTLYRKIHKFRGDCSLKTWLYRVTLNQAANRNRWWRRRLRHQTRSLSLGLGERESLSVPEPASTDPSPHRHCYSTELRRAIEKGIKELPFEQRSAVVLRDVEGLTYEEIAQATGARVGTVKSRIARGRERLREILEVYRPGVKR